MKKHPYYNNYHIPGCSHHTTLKQKAVFVAQNVTIKHELSKCLGALMIQRYGDVFFDEEIIKHLNIIQDLVLTKKLPSEIHNFITEAAPNKQAFDENGRKIPRRVDLVDIDTGVRYEFETNHKICKKAQDKLLGETVITIPI